MKRFLIFLLLAMTSSVMGSTIDLTWVLEDGVVYTVWQTPTLNNPNWQPVLGATESGAPTLVQTYSFPMTNQTMFFLVSTNRDQPILNVPFRVSSTP